jgi:hypothetical protein
METMDCPQVHPVMIMYTNCTCKQWCKCWGQHFVIGGKSVTGPNACACLSALRVNGFTLLSPISLQLVRAGWLELVMLHFPFGGHFYIAVQKLEF